PWRGAEQKRQANRRAVDGALSDLPLQMRWDTTWEARARQAANEAVDDARNGSARDMAAVAELALRPLVSEFEHERKIQTALESAILWNGTTEEREMATESVRKALAVLAVGSSDREIEKAKSSALAPIKNEIRLREAKQELVEAGLREIYPYAERLLKKF